VKKFENLYFTNMIKIKKCKNHKLLTYQKPKNPKIAKFCTLKNPPKTPKTQLGQLCPFMVTHLTNLT